MAVPLALTAVLTLMSPFGSMGSGLAPIELRSQRASWRRGAFRKQRNFDHRCRHDRGAAWRRRAEARRRPFEAARLLAGGQGSGARARRPRRFGNGDTMSCARQCDHSLERRSRPAATDPHVAGLPKRTPEVVVVNDGSSDHTRDVIAKAEGVNIVALHNATPAGRSAASNAGAAAASGAVALFLDGDTLAAPDLVSEHLRRHGERANSIVRGP